MDNFLHFSSLVVSALLLLSINRGSQRFTVVFLSSHLWVKALETLEHASFIPVNAEIIHLQLMENEKLKSFSFWASLSRCWFFPQCRISTTRPNFVFVGLMGREWVKKKFSRITNFNLIWIYLKLSISRKLNYFFFVCKTTPAIFHSAICNYKITRGISLFYPAAAASSVVQLQQIAKKREKNCCKVCSVLQFKSLGNFFSFFRLSFRVPWHNLCFVRPFSLSWTQ